MRKFDSCYTVILGAEPGKRIGLVKYGESGYYLTDFDSTTASIEDVQTAVRQLNEKLGTPADVCESMAEASCFGWNTPCANKAHHYFGKPEAAAPPRVVVTFKDGLVADVYADRPVKVAVIDYDPAQDDEITYIPAQGLGDKPAADEPALASVNDAAVLPDSIEDVFAAINRQLVK